MTVRNRKGQFEKGHSGNEYGRRPREKPVHNLPAKNRKVIFDIAEREMEVTIGGERQRMSLFEASLLRMAIAGANGDRIAARQFAQLVSDTAKEDLTMRLKSKLLMQQLDHVREENERLRAKVEARTGVVTVPYDWSQHDNVADDGRLDDGRTTMEGEAD
ncbi:MAG TPA: DUF5681 domain-containing protein [Caulobacteraceae bacterium]|nr:DUF5681 domain-containing protein [Caulobacteraceae bacterium]